MTYEKAYSTLKTIIESEGYTVYPAGMSGQTSTVLPLAELYIKGASTLTTTTTSLTYSYEASIRIVERLREAGIGESDITLIPKRWGQCDTKLRSIVSKAGLRRTTIKMGMGYVDKGNIMLITIIKGEL